MASLADVSRAIMRSARAATPLDIAAERALLARYQADADQGAVDRVAASNLRHVISVANSLRGYGLPLDDLVQEGCCGMMLAAGKYDPGKDVPFFAYARLWAKAEMQEFILRNWSIVRLPMDSVQQKLFFKMRRMRAELSRDPDKSPSEVSDEIAAAFGVTAAEVDVMQARLGLGDFALNAPVSAEDNDAEWGDFFASEEPLADDLLDDFECEADLRRALADLDERERLVIQERWLTDDIAPLAALAEWFSITTKAVRQLEVSAIQKLRRSMMSARAAPRLAHA